VGIYIMVQRKELSDIAKLFEGKTEKSPKQKDAPRKTTKEHLSDFSDNPGGKIGGRGFLVG
jgi:hypothetical protein